MARVTFRTDSTEIHQIDPRMYEEYVNNGADFSQEDTVSIGTTTTYNDKQSTLDNASLGSSMHEPSSGDAVSRKMSRNGSLVPAASAFRMAANVAKKFKRKSKDATATAEHSIVFEEDTDEADGFDADIDAFSSTESIDSVDQHPYSRKSKIACLEKVIQPSGQNYPQDFSISINIVELQKLQGLNLNPMVEIQVGDDRKKTSCKESTNCPYYDEYFVFDYMLPERALLEKIITFTVYSASMLTKGRPLGTFKIEAATVYAFPGHQVYHKWAALTDPEDGGTEAKGYLQCDIAITGKDASKPAPEVSSNPEDIEKNLLMPPGCGYHGRQKARIMVKIYRAEDLPYMNLGILAGMKKVFSGERTDLVDPYVQVSFGGLKCRTSVKKGQCSPVWNEELSFIDALPALCSTMQIQLKDKDSVTDDVIGTYYIDLMSISNTGTTGFLPTFGPCWVNLYGSNREVNMLDEHRALNSGEGEGIAYRGRLLIAVSTKILNGTDIMDETTENGEITRIPQVAAAQLPKKEDFLLLGSLFEASMISNKFKNQTVQFELSIGNSNEHMMQEFPVDESGEEPIRKVESRIRIPIFSSSNNDDKLPLIESQRSEIRAEGDFTYITQPQAPSSHGKNNLFMDFREKPCLSVQAKLEDTTIRMYTQNLLGHLTRTFSAGLSAVRHKMEDDNMEEASTKLAKVVAYFGSLCSKYSDLIKIDGRSTQLDKERRRICKIKLESVASKSRAIRSMLTLTNVKDRLRQAHEMLADIENLSNEPQDSIPDIFIWMLVDGKRVAYFRLPARDVLHGAIESQRGRLYGKYSTILLKLPGKRSVGAGGWQLQAKLTIMLWLGLYEDRDKFMETLPAGCTPRTSNIPRHITFKNDQKYQLRTHLYQARAIVGSDSSGLSDPFAVITMGDYSCTSQVIYETLSPTWNQMLVIDDITLPFPGFYMKSNPPVITIELFDQDSIVSTAANSILPQGTPDYLGRAFAFPLLKLSNEIYDAPMFPALLQWWPILRGQAASGELLASFELLQKPFDIREVYRCLLAPRQNEGTRRNASAGLPTAQELQILPHEVDCAIRMESEPITPIPGSIRPVFSKHRIEVLFWGVREMKKLQFTSVTKPRIDVECAGHVISSVPLTDALSNPNFVVTTMHTDVDLPDNQMYCPPITLRCVDCRSFGRFVLVGTTTINSLQKYLYKPKVKQYHDNKKRDGNTESGGDNLSETRSISGASVRDALSAATLEPNSQTTATLTNGKVVSSTAPPAFKLRHANLAKATNATDKLNNVASGLLTSMDAIKSKTKLGSTDNLSGSSGSVRRKKKREAELNKEREMDEIDWASLDWWSKYYASIAKQEAASAQPPPGDEVETYSITDNGYSTTITTYNEGNPEVEAGKAPGADDSKFKHIHTMKIYDRELEAMPEFNAFCDWLHTFPLLRGKKISDDEPDDARLVGKFKGCLQIYKWPPMLNPDDKNIVGGDPQLGMFAGVSSNLAVKVLVRVYIVLAKNLHPQDLNGKADPYLIVKIGNKVFNDKEKYKAMQLNPVFGSVFEHEVTFPMETQLTVSIWDWDMLSKDDLIGETKIDLENRFYSRHRAICGMNAVYHSSGYNAWRDRAKPSHMLAKMCSEAGIGAPHYRLHQGKVTVNGIDFYMKDDDAGHMEENLAMEVLRRWPEANPGGLTLVPEHVETRSLYDPEKPGVEQGKVQMWVDMFSLDTPAIPKAVDISPRQPKCYELRVTIWNTDEVILEEEDLITGERSSDIYVKGWLTGPDDSQSTDVHYRSLTGEGNFNWRFVLPFEYLVAEQKIVIKKKESIFNWDESETKMPAKLTLQVWDADHISADDFLGNFTGDLTHFPRGAKSMESCKMLDSSTPTLNLFKQKRVKGWWPCETEDGECAGKIEAEIELVTAEEAEAKPVGLGRNEPEPLEKPNRPDTAFLWFLNPLKSIKYMFCKRFKWIIIKAFIAGMLLLLVILLIYNIPGYTAKKILQA